MGRSILAVVLGYLVMAVVVAAGTFAAARALVPGGMIASGDPLPTAYVVVNLIVSFVGAVLGGWLCARVAPRRPFKHASVLAFLIFILACVAALTRPESGPQPDWYPWVIGVIGVAGVLLGGWLRAGPRRANIQETL